MPGRFVHYHATRAAAVTRQYLAVGRERGVLLHVQIREARLCPRMRAADYVRSLAHRLYSRYRAGGE